MHSVPTEWWSLSEIGPRDTWGDAPLGVSDGCHRSIRPLSDMAHCSPSGEPASSLLPDRPLGYASPGSDEGRGCGHTTLIQVPPPDLGRLVMLQPFIAQRRSTSDSPNPYPEVEPAS